MSAVLCSLFGGHQPRVLLASTETREWQQGPDYALTMQTQSMAERITGGSNMAMALGRCHVLPVLLLSLETAEEIKKRYVLLSTLFDHQ